MSTDSTAPPERRSLVRRLLVPAAIALALGALGGGTAYFLLYVRNPPRRTANAAAVRRVATTHMLVAIEDAGGEQTAVVLVGRTSSGAKLLTIPPTTVVDVPGLGPRTVSLALHDAGPEAAAVAVANALRITVPAALTVPAATAAGSVDTLGGVDVTVPAGAAEFTGFGPGPAHLGGDGFVRYMTAAPAHETDEQLALRQAAGWRGLLAAMTRPQAQRVISGWTVDIPTASALDLMRACAQGAEALPLPVTPIALAGANLVELDEGAADGVRRALADFSNGASTLEGRRIRLVIRTDAAAGPVVGRILVNAGYVIVMSGKTTTTSPVTRIAVAPSVPDADAAGRDVADLLGMGVVRVSTDISADADIILTIGMDWAETNGLPPR
jgi:hypothetical protein